MARRNETVEEFCERTINTMWHGEAVDRWIVQEKPAGASKWRVAETIERSAISGDAKKAKAGDLVVAIERAIVNADARKARVQAWVPSYTRNQVAQKVWPQLQDVSEVDDDEDHFDPLSAMVGWNQFLLTQVSTMWNGTLDTMKAMYTERTATLEAEVAIYRADLTALRTANNELADKQVERQIRQQQSHTGLEIAKSITHGVTAKVLGTAPTEKHLDSALQAFANSLTPEQVKAMSGVLRPDQTAALATLLIKEERDKEEAKAPFRVTPEFLKAARSRMKPPEYKTFLQQLHQISEGPATT